MTTTNRKIPRRIMLIGLAAMFFTDLGCGMIKPTRGRRAETVHSGFLGDYTGLAKREGYPAQEVYVNPEVKWSSYYSVYIESATVWLEKDSKLSEEDAQHLTNMLYATLHEKLGEKFLMAERGGPGVIKLRIALTQAKGARVPMNVVTTLVPQARALWTFAGLATDTAAFVGAASAEIELRDAITDQRLAAAVDSRAGTKGITRAFSKWADVQAICDYWADRLTTVLTEQGVRQKVS